MLEKSHFSPNFNRKSRKKSSIKAIVIHYTGMRSQNEAISRLCSPKSKVSSHFLIGQHGKVYKLVDENKVAWHAGTSCWGRFKNLNKNSIGIELVNRGHQFGYTNFKKKQINKLIQICKKLIQKYKIKKQNIIGHSDISPSRKIDPGEKFPWRKLAINKIGNWHNFNQNLLKKSRRVKASKNEKIKFANNLRKIGYCFNGEKNYKNTVKAFQRHFRKELVDGREDEECLIIAKNLSKKV